MKLFWIYGFIAFVFWAHPIKAQNLLWSLELLDGMNFSSMAAHDLDKNGNQELIIGYGKEDTFVSTALVMVSHNGQILWEFQGKDQLYTQPIFKDITGDQIDDIFIGGRMAGYYAIDGSNGQLIWKFWNYHTDPLNSNWFNFYGGVFVKDG